jgi:hypothetical protein
MKMCSVFTNGHCVEVWESNVHSLDTDASLCGDEALHYTWSWGGVQTNIHSYEDEKTQIMQQIAWMPVGIESSFGDNWW